MLGTAPVELAPFLMGSVCHPCSSKHGEEIRGFPKAEFEWAKAGLFIVLILSLAFQCPLISASDEGDSTQGDFVCDHVVVEKINLSLKEVDLSVDVYVVANSSFLMGVWVPWKEGGTFWALGVPVENSPHWHEYHLREMPMNRLTITTVWNTLPVFLGLNPFPFESYNAEIVFGFNITDVRVSPSFKPRPTLSPDLEEGGVWNVTLQVKESGSPNTLDAGRVVTEKGLKSFVTLSIMLSHPPPYVWRMLIPTWGPLIFLGSVFIAQLLIRRKLGREYQAAIAVVTASMSAAGVVLIPSLGMGASTVPDLTLSQVLTFGSVVIYPLLVVAFWPRKQQIPPQEKLTAAAPIQAVAWDLFICHATEDKDEIARPLADALTAKSLKVWYDEFTLTLGDSLSRKIDEGLANSRFGVVILSPSFFKKEWPRRELDGLTAKEISYGKTILPVWHKVDRDYVLRYSPTLADKLAVSTSEGLDEVVDEILKAVSRSSTERSSKDISPLPRVSSEQDKDMFARQLQDLPAGIGVLGKITSRGYWKVLLRPQVFKQDRVPTLLDCEKHVTDCHVSLRGWNYPHYSRIESGLENVWCQTDSDDRKEFWCFYQSAQFVNYFACIEDWWQDSRWWSSETAKGHGPGEALEIWSTLFRLMEIYEFASRLAQKGVFGGDLYVSVDLHGMFERKLVALHGSLDEEFTSKIVDMDFEKRFSVQELISKAPELALEHLLWIFERFGWRDVSSETVDVLKVEQKKLLERRL